MSPRAKAAFGSKPSDILKVAQMYIAAGWTQGPAAADSKGNDVPYKAPEACRWCMFGAIQAAGQNLQNRSEGHRALERVEPCYIDWNEAPGRTQDEVLEAFERAIALAEAEESAP